MTIDFLKIGSGVASAALIIGGFAHGALAQDATIDHNGTESDNSIIITEENTTDIDQTNTNDSTVTLTVSNNSGDNTANNNTDTDGGITTGDSTTSLNVTLGGMVNEAAVEACPCDTGDDDDTDDADGLTISTNGSGSSNFIDRMRTNTDFVTQSNDNNADVDAVVANNSGGNESSGNTGGDDTDDVDDVDDVEDEEDNRRSRIRTGSNNTTVGLTIRGSRNSFFRLNGLTFNNGL